MSDLAERAGLWEPCQSCKGSGLSTTPRLGASVLAGVNLECDVCNGAGRFLNPAAQRAVWAMVDWIANKNGLPKSEWIASEARRDLCHELTAMLEGAGSPRPKEASDA